MRTRRANRVAGIFCLALGFTILSAAKPKGAADVQQERVTKALKAEAMGSRLDRAQMLESLLSGETIADEVYWQAGYVKVNDRWVAHDKVSFDTQTQELLAEYAKYRDQHWGHEEEHIQIANWCREKGLNEQARAHLMSVLLKHPGNGYLRQALGYRRIAGEWMNASEFEANRREYLRLQARLESWGPEVIRIRNGLSSGQPPQIASASKSLSQITDPDAIAALDLFLLPQSEFCATKCVEQLARIVHRESSISLCRTALTCPWRSVAEQAVTELKHRDLDDYVPAMLAGTRINHNATLHLYWDDPLVNARGYMTLMEVSTTAEEFTGIDQRIHRQGLQFRPRPIVQQAVTNIPRVFSKARTFSELEHHFQNEIVASDNDGQLALLAVGALDQSIDSLKASEEQARLDGEFNASVAMLMSRVVPDRSFDSIQDVWNWWNQTAELGIDRSKLHTDVEVSEFSSGEFEFWIASCFTAGTPVWSEFGSRPIESLKIGDRVLTKNVETGELTYRPVIRTTYRETNQPLIRVQMGDEPITATGGHLFWVSGSGWIKARDLKPGHRVHTPTGTVEVAGVEEVATEPTYNLVIDGFHTYFVGNGKALCHDVSLASPTDAVVPGLLE